MSESDAERAERQKREAFVATAPELRYWQDNAREYWRAGNYLLDGYDPRAMGDPSMVVNSSGSCSPVMLLYAVAVENLLKALRIGAGTPAIVNGRLNPELGSHRLRKHAEEAVRLGAALTLDADQWDLLDKLHAVIQSGKYPVGKGPGMDAAAFIAIFPNDVDRVWAMIEKLETAIAATGKPHLPPLNPRRVFTS